MVHICLGIELNGESSYRQAVIALSSKVCTTMENVCTIQKRVHYSRNNSEKGKRGGAEAGSFSGYRMHYPVA